MSLPNVPMSAPGGKDNQAKAVGLLLARLFVKGEDITSLLSLSAKLLEEEE